MSPRVLYGALAQAEAVTWGFLLAGMAAKYVFDLGERGVQVAGPVHGFVFLAFCLVTVVLSVDARWSAKRLVAGLACAVVPFATVPFESSAERAGLVPDTWRLREERPTGPAERTLALALRFPGRASLVALAGLVVVFSVLLVVGPPVQVG